MLNCYKILGVTANANQSQIKQAFRSLSLRLHPDKNKNTNVELSDVNYLRVLEAYQVLSNPETRYQHDLFVLRGASSHGEGVVHSNKSQENNTNDALNNIYSTYGKSPYDVLRSIFEDKPIEPKDQRILNSKQFNDFRMFIEDEVTAHHKHHSKQESHNSYRDNINPKNPVHPHPKEVLHHKMANKVQDRSPHGNQLFNLSKKIQKL